MLYISLCDALFVGNVMSEIHNKAQVPLGLTEFFLHISTDETNSSTYLLYLFIYKMHRIQLCPYFTIFTIISKSIFPFYLSIYLPIFLFFSFSLF